MKHNPSSGVRLANARLLTERLTMKVRLERAARAQGIGLGEGARSPVSLVRAPVELVELSVTKGDGRSEPLTLVGYKTARTALPRVLGSLEPGDPRRLAAGRYATIAEQVGAMPIVGLEAPGTRRASDGGACHRAEIAAELRALQCAIGVGWVLRPRRQAGGARRAIRVRAAVDAVCLQGLEAKSVLRAHGWTSCRGDQVRAITEAVHAALDRMAILGAFECVR